MSEQEENALSRVSISTGVIPFPSMDSSLLRQNLSAQQESSLSPSSESTSRPSASTSALPEPHTESPSQRATSDVSTLSFPTPIPDSEPTSPRPEPVRKTSRAYSVAGESYVTSSSSKLTSSDKLSALPSSLGPSNPHNFARTTKATAYAASANNKRGYRRSLDTSSLPSFSMADPDSQVQGHLWGTTGFNGHTDADGTMERHPTPENGSVGSKETPKQHRVSFDSDHGSLPTMHSVGQAFLRMTKKSDPTSTSPRPSPRPSGEHRDADSSSNPHDIGSPSQSPPRSRATSPLRIFQQWSSGLLGHRTSGEEEPFVPVDPFKLHSHTVFCCFPQAQDLESSTFSGAYDCDDLIPTQSVRTFILDTLPRVIYLNFLLYLPSMYFTRVARVFADAEVSKPDMQRMFEALGRGGMGPGPGLTSTRGRHDGMPTTGAWEHNVQAQSTPIPMSTFSPPAPGATAPLSSVIQMPLPFPDEWTPQLVSPALIRFKHSWESFIDSVMREWKTLNVVSALLASTILTIFQIPSAEDDPVTRTAALMSLICALMSLSYGCMYIVRFGMMRNMLHASRWAEEAQKMKTSIWWNVWVLLAMPAVWMAWAMVLFLLAILSFTWRTGSVSDPSERPPLGTGAALGTRIAITCVLVLGLGYMAMIVITLKSYGAPTISPRILPGMETRNTMQGGGPSAHGPNMTQSRRSTPNEKERRAKDVDAAMEQRGRLRERSISIRKREEDVDRRRNGGQSGGGENVKKGVRNPTGMHGLGLGSRVKGHNAGDPEELEAIDLMIKGLH